MTGFEIWIGTLFTIHVIIYFIKTCVEIAEYNDESEDDDENKEIFDSTVMHLYC